MLLVWLDEEPRSAINSIDETSSPTLGGLGGSGYQTEELAPFWVTPTNLYELHAGSATP